MNNLRPYLILPALFMLVTVAAPAGSPFLDLDIDEALARAKVEEKLVFIDFYADWCQPCKQLDSTTFADDKVVEWLGEYTVPVKIDIVPNIELAQRFLVRSVPTLIFLKSDGTELQRTKGYQTSDQFLEVAGEVGTNQDKDGVARAREELETGHWPEAMARHKLATALVVAGNQEGALAEYLKALDSLDTDPMSRQYWTQLILDIGSLAVDYTPAGEALADLREPLVKRLESGEADRMDVKQILIIDTALEQPEKTLELYIRLKEEGILSSELLSVFARDCRELMLAEGHYEILEAENPGGLLFNALQAMYTLERQRAIGSGDYSAMGEESAKRLRQQHESMGEERRAEIAVKMEREQMTRIGEFYQIALGVGKTEDASVIARKFLESTSTAEAYHLLAANALSSGKPAEADLEYAEKAVELDKGVHPEYLETRDRLRESADQG